MENLDNFFQQKTFENLFHCLLSMVIHHNNNNGHNHDDDDDDDSYKSFLIEILPFTIWNPIAIKLTEKYHPNSIEKYFSLIKKQIDNENNGGVGGDGGGYIDLIRQFNHSLYPSIIGSNDDRFNLIRFDDKINQIHQDYYRHLLRKQSIEHLKRIKMQKLQTIIDLTNKCLNNQSIQSNVMAILDEKQCQYEVAKQKLDKQKELENVRQLLMKSNDDQNQNHDIHQQYRTITVENQLLLRKINKFTEIKQQLQRMDCKKIDRIRHLTRNIYFMEKLSSTSIPSPIISNQQQQQQQPQQQQQQQQMAMNSISPFFCDHHVISPALMFNNDDDNDYCDDGDVSDISLSFNAQLKF
ncbi:hypothetical protein DERF_015819 [Dermatophagoides farinae]|uniref:Uncharacterized protein n=1 Tax=Dermatophagoides farinae TaxID=6954 RepID=A0A922HKG3_DERFA|nr:hypothetical protein DERF_015819 [Dermatophagoides farinae]